MIKGALTYRHAAVVTKSWPTIMRPMTTKAASAAAKLASGNGWRSLSGLKSFVSKHASRRIPNGNHHHDGIVKSFSLPRVRPMATRTASVAALAAEDTSSSSSSSPPPHGLALLCAGMLAAAVAGGTLDRQRRNPTDCCGIIGVVGKPGFDTREALLDGLTILKNRGYDSAGIATMHENGKGPIKIVKFASVGDKADSIELVRQRSTSQEGHTIGIAHTRWATHGRKSDNNAHPHMDSTGKIVVVHNGTIDNANLLRQELQKKGNTFTSETDTEVIAKLIGDIYYQSKENQERGLLKAVEAAMSKCTGSWGLAVMCADEPDKIVAIRNGSPLVIGLSEECTFIASSTDAFNRYTQAFVSLEEGEIAELHADAHDVDINRAEIAPEEKVELTPDPHPHWTLKECLEQPESISRTLGFGSRLSPQGAGVVLGGLNSRSEDLIKVRHMLLSGCGTSLYAAKFGEKLMKELECFDTVTTMDAAETEQKDWPMRKDLQSSAMIVVSQSGETRDVYNVVNAAMNRGVTVMSIVNKVGSLIARTTRLGIFVHAGRESAVASTKAFTSQVTALALMTLWFRQARNQAEGPRNVLETTALKDALLRLPLTVGMALRTRVKCKEIAERLKNKEHCFILGKGLGEPIAYEGALKFKECGYLHTEGFSGGALKHGPFALIEGTEGKQGPTPIIMLILDDRHANHMRTAAEEVKARGAEVIVITDKASLAQGLDDNPIVIPHNGPLTALAAVIPLQLIAYELAVARGINPDTPRNLAKAVTVD